MMLIAKQRIHGTETITDVIVLSENIYIYKVVAGWLNGCLEMGDERIGSKKSIRIEQKLDIVNK